MNQLKAGALLNYVVLGLNAIVGLTYTPYLLRMLGQSEYGIYSLAASIIAYLSILDLGFGNAVIRYTAKFRAEGKSEEQYKMFGMFTLLYSLIGIVVLLAGIVLYFNIHNLFGSTLTPEEISQTRVIVLLMIFNLAVTFPLSIYGGIITAYENFIFLRVLQILRILISTIVMICLLSFGYKAVALVVVQTVFNISTLALNYVYCKKKIRIHVRFQHADKTFLKEVAIYSFWIFLNAIMDRIYWSTGQFVLGATSGTIAVSVFALAIQLQGMYMMFSGSLVGVLLPKTTAMITNNCSDQAISDLFIKTGRLQFAVLAFILSGFIVFGQSFIQYWAGYDYSVSYTVALLFFVPLTVPLIQNLGITILQARNQMRFRSLLYLFLSLGSLGLQIILARYYGVVGCAVAVAFPLVIGQIIVMNIYYQRKQGIQIGRFWKEITKMSIVPVLLILLAQIGLLFYPITSVMQMCLYMMLFSLFYIPLFVKFSLNTYEKGLLNKPLQKLGFSL